MPLSINSFRTLIWTGATPNGFDSFSTSPKGLSPRNNPVLNPRGYKALIDTGAERRCAVRGLRHLVADMIFAPRMPSMFEPDAFTVGGDGSGTPGSVVFRSEVLELIQYVPRTDPVSFVPLLMDPTVINKFYIMNIAAGRSISEDFVPCWRNDRA